MYKYKVYDKFGGLVSDNLTSLKQVSDDLKNAGAYKSDIYEAIRSDGMYTEFRGHIQKSSLSKYPG